MKQISMNFKESAWHWLILPPLPDQNFHSKLLFGCIYRKGSTSTENNVQLLKILKESTKHSDLLTICGDFNFKTINWKLHSPGNSTEAEFLETIDDLFLDQHIYEFTRKRGTDKPSLLDLVISDQSQILSKPRILDPLGKSDHSVLVWHSTFQSSQIPLEDLPEKPNYHKGNYKKMRISLGNIDWDKKFENCEDVDTMVNRFEEIIHDNVREFVPMKKANPRGSNRQAPWIDFKLLRTIKRKYHAWKRFQKTKLHSKYIEYVKERRKASKKIRSAKRSFEMKLAKDCKVNPKAFFSYANSKKRSSTNFIRLEKPSSDEFTSTDQETAEVLNNFFSSVFTKESEGLDSGEDLEIPSDIGISDIDISLDDISKLLMSIDPNKSPGDDGIHPKVLKECYSQIAIPLLRIFKMSISTGKFPSSWKPATVTPIYKSGEHSKPENYRPISITSQVGKILEKIVRRHIMSYVMDNQLLSDHQHGFCDKRSCMTNLIEALEEITSLIDKGIPVDEIFLDFTKAFDKVSHKKLIFKLKRIGIGGNVLLWLSSFLSDRKQRVKINNKFSPWADVTSGVPQGSVLGPTLFLIFINDLPDMIASCCKLFADDSKLFGPVKDDAGKSNLQEDLNKCAEWAKLWSMEFHPDKCKVLHFGSNNKQQCYHMNGQNIASPGEEKDLGVTLTNTLKWETHVSNCVKKGNRMVGMIKKTFSYMNQDMFLCLYKALVRPMLEYCTEVWNPHLEKDIKALENVQRRATKLVPQLSKLPYDERLRSLKLYPLKDRRMRGDMITVYKMMNGMIDINRDKIIPMLKTPLNGINTRSHDKQLKGSIVRTESRKSFFTQRIVLPWNTLSTETVNSTSVTMFKGRYDNERLSGYQ